MTFTKVVRTLTLVEDTKMFRVPPLLHPKFTGRRDAIERMQKFLLGPSDGTRPRRAAIYGLPGAGKTQLALKYAHENRDHYPQVFHAFAATRERLAMEYEKWVREMDLRAARGFSSQEQKVDAMRNWFQTNDGWLLILDNVGGSGTSDFPITDFLPAGSTGTVLFTTRNEFVAKGLAPDDGAMLLERMDCDDAIDLILKTAGIKDPTEKIWMVAKEIQEELGGLPIALEQAGTAMNDLDGTLGPQQYLDRLRSNKIELLAQPNGFSVTGSDTVSATFNGVLKGCSPDAVLLLELFSFLDPEGIPTDLLREGIYGLQLMESVKRHPSVVSIASPPLRVFTKIFSSRKGSLTPDEPAPELKKKSSSWSFFKRRYSISSQKHAPVSPSPSSPPPPLPPSRRSRITSLLAPENVTRLEGVVRELKSSSLLRLNRRDYWIHDLVREFAFKRLQPSELNEMLACVIDMVAAAFPLIDSEDQRTNNCNKYRTTAKAVIAMADQYIAVADTPTLWELKHRLARHLWHLGLHDEAEPLAYVAYEQRTALFGPKHELTMASAFLLGNIWVCWPRDEEKVIPFWEALCELAETRKGPMEDFTLESKRVLCICYRNSDALDPAERMITAQSALVVERFGATSELGLRWRNDLTVVLYMRDKLEEADVMSLCVWRDCFETLGNDHKLTVSAFDTRAYVLLALGRTLEVAGNQIISRWKNTAIYGSQHPDVSAADQGSVDAIWSLLIDSEQKYDQATLEAAVAGECRRIMEFTGDKEALADFETYEAMVKENVKLCVDFQVSLEGDDQQADSGYEEGMEEPEKAEGEVEEHEKAEEEKEQETEPTPDSL